jgi:hypothetical protein
MSFRRLLIILSISDFSFQLAENLNIRGGMSYFSGAGEDTGNLYENCDYTYDFYKRR